MRRPLFRCPCCEGEAHGPGEPGRRAVLGGALGGLALAAGLSLPRMAAAVSAGAGERSIAVHRAQTGETFDGAYWRDGRYLQDALSRLDWVMRDPAAEEATPMDPRLFDLLFTIAGRLDATEPYEVLSGYRAPETNAARAARSRRVSRVSLHMSGMAADVRLPGRDAVGVARLAAEMQAGGVGLYRSTGFVHLDCGPARRW